MSSSIVVGYTATDAGADALALGAHLARALGAHVRLVTVLPRVGAQNAGVPADRGFDEHIRGQAQTWLRSAVDSVDESLTRSGHVRFAESFADGLVAAAEEFGATLVVVGAGHGGILGRHRLGSVATELVHSAPVAVALAPAGYAQTDAAPMTRVTAAIGTRPGAEVLLDTAVLMATAAHVPLRLVSLTPFDVPAGLDTGAVRVVRDDHAAEVLAKATASLDTAVAVTTEHAPGAHVEEAVAGLAWTPGEIVLVGSSRLAQPRRLFLGSTAAKMLRELPVPLVVVPRGADPRVIGDRT